MKKTSFILILFVAAAFLVTGCATPKLEPKSAATLGYITATHKDLINLPKPKGKIVVAVYSFRDQTGQYKYHPSVSTFSTAVTQGATSMLIQALNESGWFIPVEREGLNDLLTERKIIRAKLKDDSSLPSLIHAPVMMEGGIISYETNVSTGGFGAKYFGIGGSAQYQKDQVSIYLRTVDVSTSEILQSVSTTKSILSQAIDFGIFRYVEVKELLEVETGYTTNEPPQLCVLEAIEKAVVSMIVEGILDNQWALADPADMDHPVIQNYLQEKQSRILVEVPEEGK